MVHYKISFLIVLMLSVVYLSANTSDEEEDYNDDNEEVPEINYHEDDPEFDYHEEDPEFNYHEEDPEFNYHEEDPEFNNEEEVPEIDIEEDDPEIEIKKCKDAMHVVFHTSKSPIRCIRHGITFMKLYGDHAFPYDQYVREYYETFYLYANYEKIRLPEVYCKFFKDPDKIEKCKEEILVFQERPTQEIDPPGEPSGSKSKKVKYSKSQDTKALNDILKRNVFMNALYHHVIYYKSSEFEPTADAKKYFHLPRSYGFKYLTEIARQTRLKKAIGAKMNFPAQYCDQHFNKKSEVVGNVKITYVD